MGNFWWSQRMKFNGRKLLLDLPECAGVKIESQLRMMSSLEQKLVTTIADSFHDLFPVGGHIGDVGFCMSGYAIKIAEFTISNTNIGRIHIPVYLPGNLSMRHLLFSQFIGYKHEFCQRSMFKKKHPFLHFQETKTERFFV